MKKSILLTFLMVVYSTTSFGQMEGDQWVIGYYGSGSPQFSVLNLDFRSGYPQIILRYDLTMKIQGTASNICNAAGEPIIWTNGMEIFGRNGVKIADTIAYSGSGFVYWNHYYNDFSNKPDGFVQMDGATILPMPETDDTYSVIYHSAELYLGVSYRIPRFLEARIRMEEDSSYTNLHQDSLIGQYHQWYSKRIKAVRHGNGRDWWIVAFEENTGRYYSYVLDPNGIRLFKTAETTPVQSSSGGVASFSPNGKYFVRTDAPSSDEPTYLTLYSFDRCSGDFELLETITIAYGGYTSANFSPSERYLYGNSNSQLWQWDLWAEDIKASQTLVDTFDGFTEPPGGFGTYFGPQILAPDGRIYMIPPAGSSRYMHVIERPDLPAEDCRFLQHHINLTVPNGRSVPNIPNFRQGPLDGSPCDTLGLDNLPVSRWRHEEDQPGWRYDIRFTDLSFYDPKEWHWDFGDGNSSDETSPVYTYESSGIYEVCLTVSNENGSDTKCQEVEILTTALQEALDKTPDLSISPNPFVDQVQIASRSGVFRVASLEVFDMHGTKVFHQASIPVPITLKMPQLPSGMYLFRIRDQDGTLYSFKAMKV